MTSVKAVQRETTVYAYCGWSEGAVLIMSASPTLPLHTSDLKQMAIRKAQAKIYLHACDAIFVINCLIGCYKMKIIEVWCVVWDLNLESCLSIVYKQIPRS